MSVCKVKKLVLGAVQTNCYLLCNTTRREAVVIDPADDAETIARTLTQLSQKPVAILLTHGHFDHILAADALKKAYGIPVYAHQKEAALAADPQRNAGALFGMPGSVQVDITVTDGQVLTLAGFEIQVLYTPGHTIGGVCYYLPQEQVLFSGDTLFAQSVGRTDLPTGSHSALVRAVREKLFVLPDAVRVCPGHEGETSIGEEKQYNPFL